MKNRIFPIFYSALLITTMLYPFDFDFLINHARWLEFENGIHFKEKGQIISKENTFELYEKLVNGTGLTIEVWIKTSDLMQSGPGRIISYSIDNHHRNFTLGQSKDNLVFRLRTEQTDLNGVFPHMVVPHIFETLDKIHIVVTYDFERQCIFINGKNFTCDDVPKGTFSNWDSACKLVAGNEVNGERPWIGMIYYAAIYDQALDSEEVKKKFGYGIPVPECSKTEEAGSQTCPLVCYRFNEKNIDLIKDTGTGGINLDLHIPNRLPVTRILNIDHLNYPNMFLRWSNLFHIFIFIPLGIYLHRFLTSHVESRLYIVFIILIIGLVLSLMFEILQYFLPDRGSSIIGLIANLIGLCFGIILVQYRLKQASMPK